MSSRYRYQHHPQSHTKSSTHRNHASNSSRSRHREDPAYENLPRTKLSPTNSSRSHHSHRGELLTGSKRLNFRDSVVVEMCLAQQHAFEDSRDSEDTSSPSPKRRKVPPLPPGESFLERCLAEQHAFLDREELAPVRNISASRWAGYDLDTPEVSVKTPDTENTEDGRSETPEFWNMMQGCRDVNVYEKMNKIGGGTYGDVYKARDKQTGEVVALKKMKTEKETEGFPVTALREINILVSLRHPSIVHFKEVVVGSGDQIYMVMEYMDHDVKSLAKAMKQGFSQSEVKCLVLQLLQGVDYLHENGVIHRDLKTSNLLMNDCGELKICDFGMSRMYERLLNAFTPLVVTLHYRAPELLLGATEYSTAIDMWSVGCIMTELLSKKTLFGGTNEFDQLSKIFGILGLPNEKMWPGFTKLPGAKVNFKRTSNELLKMFPRSALSVSGFNLLKELLTYDPMKRITAKDAINHPWFHESPLPMAKEFLPSFPAKDAHGMYLEAPVCDPVRKISQISCLGSSPPLNLFSREYLHSKNYEEPVFLGRPKQKGIAAKGATTTCISVMLLHKQGGSAISRYCDRYRVMLASHIVQIFRGYW